MRHELSDYKWGVINPMLLNKPRGVPRVDDRHQAGGEQYPARAPRCGERQTRGIYITSPWSLPGLTRQSILRRKLDARVKPAHDAECVTRRWLRLRP